MMKRLLQVGVLVSLVMGLAFPGSARAQTNLIANPSAEILQNGQPVGWHTGSWGVNTPRFSVKSSGQEGTRSLYVRVTNYQSGDAKWYFDHVPVRPSTEYEFSDYYKSNVVSDVTVEIITADGSAEYLWLGSPPTSKTIFRQFVASFTTPSNAQSLTVYHNLDRNGWLQTDTFSLIEKGSDTPPPSPPSPPPTPPSPPPAPPTPPPSPSPTFTRPLISIEFDDGWRNAYENGLPIVESFGLKVTQYIITETTNWPDYMSDDQIRAMKAAGHDIGSHTVSHPHLPQLSAGQIQAELANSKSYLENLLGIPINLFVTPYCEWNQTVRNFSQQYYGSMRNCEHEPNTKTNFDRYNIRAFIVLRTTTLSEIQSWIDQTRAQNGWLVVVYHEINESGDAWGLSPAALRAQLQLLKDSAITIKKTADALAELQAQL